ncbi:MAG: ester cyclase [Bryobacteraceae bacterium]
MSEENKQLMRRFIEEAWNGRNKAVLDELLAPEYRHYMPGSPDPIIGPDGYKQLIDMFLAAFPDTRFEIEDLFGEGDRVCLLWTVHATHKGVFNGIEPTDRSISISGVGVGRMQNGRIVEIVSMFDNASFAQQLDADPIKAAEAW